jgi:homeobox protein cut-like
MLLIVCKEENNKSSRVVEIEAENRRLQKKLSEFQTEFKDIKNQEVTIRRLEDRCKELESKAEEIVQQRLSTLERGLREAHVRAQSVAE